MVKGLNGQADKSWRTLIHLFSLHTPVSTGQNKPTDFYSAHAAAIGVNIKRHNRLLATVVGLSDFYLNNYYQVKRDVWDAGLRLGVRQRA